MDGWMKLIILYIYFNREMQDRIGPAERLVLLQSQRQEIPNRDSNESRNSRWILESHWQG